MDFSNFSNGTGFQSPESSIEFDPASFTSPLQKIILNAESKSSKQPSIILCESLDIRYPDPILLNFGLVLYTEFITKMKPHHPTEILKERNTFPFEPFNLAKLPLLLSNVMKQDLQSFILCNLIPYFDNFFLIIEAT